ncbi:hypothetical protein BS47DRAFT_1339784, partial [Hydnum rufescens UP504]
MQSVTSHNFPSRARLGQYCKGDVGYRARRCLQSLCQQPSEGHDRVHRLCGPCQDGEI